MWFRNELSSLAEVSLYYIIIWDHRRICGPSTETSLCSAHLWLHTKCVPPHVNLRYGVCWHRRLWRSHSDLSEDSSLLGHYGVSSNERFATFRRNVAPPSSRVGAWRLRRYLLSKHQEPLTQRHSVFSRRSESRVHTVYSPAHHVVHP